MTNNKKETVVNLATVELDQKNTKEELSKEEKKRLRREAISSKSGLEIDESLKQPGKVYRLCNVTPGNIEKYRSMGYEVTQDTLHKGSGSLSAASAAKGCIEVEVGRSSSLKAIYMETSEENFEILRELDVENAKAQDARIYESEIPEENRIGKVTKKFDQ